MNLLKDLFVGLVFVASSAPTTAPYAMPLMVGTTTLAMDVSRTEVVSISNELSPDEEQISFASVATLDTSKPFSLRKEYVEAYFEDTPVLAAIAFCESSYRHNNEDGSVLRGRANAGDVGLMQINEWYHGEQAAELGFDIYSIRGNMAYARYLYEIQGGKPWKASQHCWSDQS